MALTDQLLSENPATVAAALKSAIDADRSTERKKAAHVGLDYYNGKHDILENRIFYYNDAGHLVEDKHAANVKIPHPFLTELIDQKVTYLLSNPVEVDAGDDAEFQERLAEYIDEEFQVTLQGLFSGSSKKGAEYLFARTTSADRLTFQVADMLQTFPVFDENHEVARIVRSYQVKGVTDTNGAPITVTRAEVWDDKQVWFFISEREQGYKLDPAAPLNPRPHVIAQVLDDDGAPTDAMVGRSYGQIPFYRLSNSSSERTDLAPVKAIIDDYDLMNAYLSNNLQDFTDALYVVKGYPGTDLDELRLNLKAKKAIAVDNDGDVDMRTVQIPVEGRKTKMDIDRENIYRFGMGFDSTQVGDGNITNVVIKSRYALLNMKVNKAEARLRAALRWAVRLIVDDINRRFGTSYSATDVTFTFTRDQLVSATDDAQVEFTTAQAHAVQINAILAAASRLDSETTLRAICDVLELDWEEVQKRLDEEAAAGPLDPGAPEGDPTTGTVGPSLTPGLAIAGAPQPTAAAVDDAEDLAGKTLNGAQTASLLSVLAQYKAGTLSRGQAVQVLSISIGVSKERAGQILDGAEE